MHEEALRIEHRVRAPREAVWTALVGRRAEWWPDMRFDARVGAALIEEWTEAGVRHVATGAVRVVTPPRELWFDWRSSGWEAALSVRILLTGSADDTVVELIEAGFGRLRSGTRVRRDHAEGWPFHLGNLARCAEGARGV